MLKSIGVSFVVLISTLSPQIGYATSAIGAESQSQLILAGEELLWNTFKSEKLALALDPGHPTQKNLTNLSKTSFKVSHGKQNESLLQIPFNQTGTLEPGDKTLENGSLYDIYTFTGQAGQIIKVSLISEDFDTRLLLLDADEELIASNDDSNDSSNSELAWQLTETKEYHLFITTYGDDERGAYQLKATFGTIQEAKKAKADQLAKESFDLWYFDSLFEEALEKSEQALKLYREIEDRYNEGITLSEIGVIYRHFRQPLRALEY